MKKILLLTIMMLYTMFLFAQSRPLNINGSQPPRTIEYKEEEHDFMLSVCSNPNLRLYDFLWVGYSEKNTKLLPMNEYRDYVCVRKQCQDKYGKFSESKYQKIYKKVSASWKVFKEVQYINVDEWLLYMAEWKPNNQLAPRCPNPQLRHKLSIVPLKLDDIK